MSPHALSVRGRGATGIPYTKGALAWAVEQDQSRGELVLVLVSASAAVQLRRGEQLGDTALLALVGSAPVYRDAKHSGRAFLALRESLAGPLEAFERSAEARQVVEDARRREAVQGALLRARAAQERRLQERAERVAAGLPAFDSVLGREMPPRDVAPSSAEAVAGAREALRVLAVEEEADLAPAVELVALPELPSVAGLRVAEVLPELLLLASSESIAKGACVAVAVIGGVVGRSESRRELIDLSEDDALARWVDRIAEERQMAWSVVAQSLLTACSGLGLQLGRIA